MRSARVACFAALAACSTAAPPRRDPPAVATAPLDRDRDRDHDRDHDPDPEPTPPAPLACVARLYGATPTRDPSGWLLSLPDHTTVPYEPDVRDVFELVYRSGPISPITDPDYDPGRVRVESLMRVTYGANAAAVQAALVTVRLRGRPFRVHSRIEAPMKRVAARLDAAARAGQAIDRYFDHPGGTFNWRTIAGTTELSMHAWAIAIDLDPSYSHYWRNEPEAKRVWRNRFPQAIVDAFEAEGFIWGGRWFHYDTMHFEYRPELLDPGCYPPGARRERDASERGG